MVSKNFAKNNATLDDMATVMVSDLRKAFYHGVTVTCPHKLTNAEINCERVCVCVHLCMCVCVFMCESRSAWV